MRVKVQQIHQQAQEVGANNEGVTQVRYGTSMHIGIPTTVRSHAQKQRAKPSFAHSSKGKQKTDKWGYQKWQIAICLQGLKPRHASKRGVCITQCAQRQLACKAHGQDLESWHFLYKRGVEEEAVANAASKAVVAKLALNEADWANALAREEKLQSLGQMAGKTKILH